MASDLGVRVVLTADAGQAKTEIRSATQEAASFNAEMRNAESVNPYKASAMASQQAYQNTPNRLAAQASLQALQAGPQSLMQKSASFFQPKIPITVDTTQAKTQIEELSRIIEDLSQKMKTALDAGDGRSAASFSIALQNAIIGRRNLMSQVNQAQTNQDKLNPYREEQGIFEGNSAWVLQQAMTQITRGILSSMDAALSAAKQRADGDYTGAAVTQRRATGELWGQGIGTAAGAGIGALLTPIFGPLAIPIAASLAGEIGKSLGGIDAKKLEESLAYSAQYKEALPAIDSLNQLYGGDDVGRRSAAENNRAGLDMYERAEEYAKGTGLSTRDFVMEAAGMGAYGVRSFDQAMNMVRSQAQWSRRTGVDMAALQSFEGKAFRFDGGRENAADIAYAGLRDQGMGNGQFGEFLNSMGRIMEEGIEKGFVRSTEEIAGNLSFLYKLSGGSPLWQGEQGARRLSQMNAAISSATSLQSVQDMITYSAAAELLGEDDPATLYVNERLENFKKYGGNQDLHTGTYVDPMIVMERGVHKDLLRGQRDAVEGLEGDNPAAQIEHYMKMFNLNYTGGALIRFMMEKSHETEAETGIDPFDEDFVQRIKDLQADKDYQSDSATLQDILNKLNKEGVKIGAIEFKNIELPVLEQTTKDILEILRKKETAEALRYSALNAPPIARPALSPVGPAGVLQPFQGGESILEYMATGTTRFGREWSQFVNYKNMSRDDYGEMLRDQVVSLLDGLEPSGDLWGIAGQNLDNFVAEFNKMKSWGGINGKEYDKLLDTSLNNLIAVLNAMRTQQITVNIDMPPP